MLIDHNRAIIEETKKGTLELRALQIQNIDDSQKRELAAIDNQFQLKLLENKKQNDAIQDTINKLNGQNGKGGEINDKQAQIDNPKTTVADKVIYQNELQSLKETLAEQYVLLGNNADDVKAFEKEKQKAIDKTINKYKYQAILEQDQINIINAGNKKGITGGKDNPFNKDLENAEVQQLKDQEAQELSQVGLTELQKYLIRLKYDTLIDDKRKEFAKARMQEEIQGAAKVATSILTIVQNNIKSQEQATEAQLARDKSRELSNTSLTSSQKLAVNEKYRQKEGQAKVKEFKADQKLSIARAIISTAEAVLKAAPIIPLEIIAAATGAAEIAVIAAQKPPAYAKGGVYKSDGTGGVLPGYSRKDNINAQLRSGEGIVVSEAMRNPYARNLVSAVNVAHGGRDFSVKNTTGGYAVGGIVTDGNNSNRYYAQPQEGTENLANNIAYSLINNFPPVFC